MRLTAVICTYNRSSLLMTTLNSINEAKRPDKCRIEIFIVPNKCTDETTNLLKTYQASQTSTGKLPLYFVEEHNVGKSHALNRAINIIEDGYLCLIDDDHRIDDNYFYAISAAIDRYKNASMFCGKIIPDWTGQEPSWVHNKGKYRIYPLPIPDFQLGDKPLLINASSRLPGGGNLIIHNGVFKRIGDFSTALGPKGHDLLGSEDSEFVLRGLSNSEIIQYVPEIVQYHYVDSSRLKLTYLINKSYQRTRSITLAHNPNRSPIPLYLWRKIINYLGGIVFSLNYTKSRFYLMRLAATLGEAVGLREHVN
ncbi:MAG: glycosyltransferase family 2 protein [Planctomycetes bacterium]|nr:glycosyltransferase family 2 protein [Planctomycetota bacterium]